MKKTAQNMGHHIQNLDKMDHNESREEASKRREEKKTKSKKARLASHKAGEPGEAAAVDNDSEDGGADNDVGPRVDKFGNALLPEPDAIRSKMLAVIASLDRSLSSIRGGETTPESFHIRGDGPDKQRWAGGHRGPAAGNDQLLRPGSSERRAGRRARRDMQGMNLAFTEGMGARLLLISITITELAAYVIMGTIYLFMCWDSFLIKERLESSLVITLRYSSNTLAALDRREAVSKRCVVASNLVSVFV